jgi:hypothetical protein
MDEKPVYDTTDIPILPLPFDPQKESNYQIALPSRYNDDGTNIVLSFPSEVPMQEAVTEIRNSFKRNSADTQWQMMLPPGDQFHLDVPTTIPDFKQWKEDKNLYEEGYNTDLSDLAIEAAKGVVSGVYSVGKEAVGMLSSADDKEMGRHAFNLVEAAMRGTENFSSLLGAGAMFLKQKGFSLVNSPEADQADYDAFTYMKGMAQQMAARGAGDMITEGGSSGMFGQLPGGDQLVAAVQKDPSVPSASPEDIKNINNAAMVLDPSWIIPVPGMQLLEKAGAKMAANTIARNFLPSVLATEVAPKMAFGALAKGGQALDYVTRGIFNTLSNVVEGVAQGSVTDASRAAANALARTTVYGTAMVSGGGALVKGALAGKAARAVGEIGLAALEGIEQGSARMAVQELSENMATSAAVRASARAVLKIMPPDSAFNAMKGIAETAMHSGMFMGGIGAMQAEMAGDDPVRGFEEGFASGVGMGSVIGLGLAPKAVEQANLNRVARYFQDDSVGRSRERVFTATRPDGTEINVPINDMQGRVDLFNRTDIPLQEREMILAITRAHEKAGGEVFFHDGSEETLNGLREAGLDAGKGFQIVDGADGRSIIVLDSNASDFSAATAAEEVFHGMISDKVIKEVWTAIGDGLGTQNATAITGILADFGSKYIAALDASPGGKPHADKLREIMAAGTAPGLSDQQRVSVLTPIINEYAANYVGAALAGMKPAKINQPQINNLWDRVWDKATSNILSAFDKTRVGISKDPITGHFFDSGGKRIQTPAMEHIVERFVDAAREGKASIDPQDTVDGATYFDVRPIGALSSVEDVVNGKQTTKSKKQKILGAWYADTLTAANAIDGASAIVVTPEVRDSGYIHANLPSDGKVVFFQRVMPEALVDHISKQVVNGRRVFDDPRVPKQWNDAVSAKRIITLDSWHNISKSMGDRSDAYYARANRWVLPLGTQQMPQGGLEGAYLDISRIWSRTRDLMKESPSTRQSFKEKGINTVEEFIPLLQRYFDNLSSPSPVPTAELPGFTPEIRNAISKSIDLKERTGASGEKDKARFKNDNGFESNFFSNLPAVEVSLGGKKGKMRRESVALASVRLDRINGISEFTLNGNPVTIRYNDDVPNLVRANFSPGKTSAEQLGDSLVVTDNESGKRMIIGANGKTKLFDGDKVTIHNSPEEAEARANKNSVAQARFSPKGEMPEMPERPPEGLPLSKQLEWLASRPKKEYKQRPERYDFYRERIGREQQDVLEAFDEKAGSEMLDQIASVDSWRQILDEAILSGEKLSMPVYNDYIKYFGAKAYEDVEWQALLRKKALRDEEFRLKEEGYQAARAKQSEARFSPKGGDKFKVGDEVTVLIRGVPQEAKLLSRVKSERGGVYYQVDIPGSALIDSNSIRPKGYVDPDAAIAVESVAGPSLAELLSKKQRTPKKITKKQAAKIQQVTLDPRSSTAATVDAVEKAYADGTVTLEDANAFKATVKSPEAQDMKTRKKVRQAALNTLNIPEIAAPVQLEFNLPPGGPDPLASFMQVLSPEEGARLRARFEQLKQEPMPGAEERVAAAAKKVRDRRMLAIAKTPSALAGGRMDEMYGAIEELFSKRGIFGPLPKTPSGLKSMAAFKEDIAKVFTSQTAERLTRSNPLVRREEIPVQIDTRTEAQRKKHSDQMLALAKKENVLRYREGERMERLEARLDKLQEKQRKKASAERAKDIAALLNQRDRMEAETDVMIKREREAAMANAMRGEITEAAARRDRTAKRASVMEQLLRERDAQMAQPESQPESAPVQPELQATVPAGLVQSSEVPVGINLFKTKAGKFRVILSSGQAIGITEEYRDAVKLAQRYATKTFRNRESVR